MKSCPLSRLSLYDPDGTVDPMSKMGTVESKQDGSELKAMIREAERIANTMPEEGRVGAFRIVFDAMAERRDAARASLGKDTGGGRSFPISVQALMNQFDISEGRIREYFDVSGAHVAPKYRICGRATARAQIRIACLQALERALSDGRFEFMPAAVKRECRKLDGFDLAGFAAVLDKRAALFKPSGDRDAVELSPLGKEHLADILDEPPKQTRCN
ncbi:MAG: hypothetical protein MPK30_09260 [Gammaproteobacteria bacterium]|nr:hypothetical protein [Gammaproteobacteria bacterium]